MAMLLVCYTGTRITELLKARWDTGEIDFENKVWIIPAERMKKKRINGPTGTANLCFV